MRQRYEDYPDRFTETGSVSEAGLHLRLTDFCITQLQAQGPSGSCNESREERRVREPKALDEVKRLIAEKSDSQPA